MHSLHTNAFPQNCGAWSLRSLLKCADSGYHPRARDSLKVECRNSVFIARSRENLSMTQQWNIPFKVYLKTLLYPFFVFVFKVF